MRMPSLFPKELKEHAFLKFLPFLILYILLVFAFSSGNLDGDEKRYVYFVHNLLNGFYSPAPPNINLWNGPGYPIIILPFFAFKLPFLWIKLFNCLLLYLSVILLYKTCVFYANEKTSMLFSVLFGLYFPFYRDLPLILTEIFTVFLLTFFIFMFMLNLKEESGFFRFFLCSFSLAFLAMTKVLFGYVIAAVAVFLALFALFTRQRKAIYAFKIFSLSLLLCLPWLLYTYSLTGKVFYWGNSGGFSLYTMSSPYKEELGDWFVKLEDKKTPLQKENHRAFLSKIAHLDPIKRDEAFKKRAIENIKNHPGKFFKNWIANIGRLLFSYPYSYAPQSINTFFTLVPNIFIVVLISLLFFPAIARIRRTDAGILVLLLFILIYLGASSVLSAYRRQFYVTLPYWFLFMAYHFDNSLSIRFKE